MKPGDYEEHAHEFAASNDDLYDWIMRNQQPGATLDALPDGADLDLDAWVRSVVKRRRQRRGPAEKFAAARAIVREFSEDDSLWPRLLSCYLNLGRAATRGFLLGSDVPAEHIAAILKALPPASIVRRLHDGAATR